MIKKNYQSYLFTTVSIRYIPSYMKTNLYITDGYRKKMGIYQCFLSMFMWSNETLNIWTHILGFLLFVGLLVYDFSIVYWRFAASLLDVFMASFVLVCFMICMMLSTLFHLLNCHSLQYFKFWLSMDMFGISAAFLGIFVSGIYYGFWCDNHAHLRYIYSGVVCLLFVVAVTFHLSPRFTGSEWHDVRVGLFTLWSLSGLLPTLHWASIHGGYQVGIVKIFLPRIFYMYAISGAAVLIYLLKLPESIFPGKFNYIGSSHQLWHVMVVGALFYWHLCGLDYAKYREDFGCSVLTNPENL